MIPVKSIYKFMFIFLFNFSKIGKPFAFIFLFYLFLVLYYDVKDISAITPFILTYLVLFLQPSSLNNSFGNSFYRYKKYLVLKRKRAHKFEKNKEKSYGK